MLNSEEFNLWADSYDKDIEQWSQDNSYPFAGYWELMNLIYKRVLQKISPCVLDLGFGTAILSTKLYEKGAVIYGQDFSSKMIALAQEKMPNAKLYQGDFALGLAEALKVPRYDSIIATYSLHHLTLPEKIALIRTLYDLLRPDGWLLIGDVAFADQEAQESCRVQAGEEWDDEESYFVYEEIKEHFPAMTFEPVSHCGALLALHKAILR